LRYLRGADTAGNCAEDLRRDERVGPDEERTSASVRRGLKVTDLGLLEEFGASCRRRASYSLDLREHRSSASGRRGD